MDESNMNPNYNRQPTYQQPYQPPPYQRPPYPPPVYQPPVYQQPIYLQPVYQPPPKNPGAGLGAASMVLGILSLIMVFIGVVTAIISLPLGVSGLMKSKKAKMPSGMAVAGIVCSSITLAIYIGILIVAILIQTRYR